MSRQLSEQEQIRRNSLNELIKLGVNPYPAEEYDVNVTKYLLDGSLQWQTNNLTGCVFTRQVNLPNETVNASNEGLTYGGFLPPATASNREKYQNLSVTFLETNASFLDLIIRPWILSVGYYGLVARDVQSPKKVKCNFSDS